MNTLIKYISNWIFLTEPGHKLSSVLLSSSRKNYGMYNYLNNYISIDERNGDWCYYWIMMVERILCYGITWLCVLWPYRPLSLWSQCAARCFPVLLKGPCVVDWHHSLLHILSVSVEVLLYFSETNKFQSSYILSLRCYCSLILHIYVCAV